MQVIISHMNLDFDGLASMLAAKKLYPAAKIVLPEKSNVPVEQFLAIYRDSMDLYHPKQIDWDLVNHLIIVDMAGLERVGSFGKKLLDADGAEAGKPTLRSGLQVTVYDHHPPSESDIKTDYGKVEFVGATVTLLLEEIIERGMDLSPFEATIMALGVYTDTGAFTYLSTTARDLSAASFLLERGANLAIVANFSERPLLDEQQQILNSLLVNMVEHHVQGIDVLVSWHRQQKYQGGLATVVRKLLDIAGSQAVFVVVEMAKKVFVIGRSDTARVNVLSIIEKLGGGGHETAASATIKDGNLAEIVDQINQNITKAVTAAVVARQMMSSPVKIITPHTSVDDVAKMILRYGHTGFPVVEEECLVGIISRRDIDKAKHHGLGHAPVKGYMATELVTIGPDTSIEEIQELMIAHNIGRMPVVENRKLLGIVTRSNVIEFLHGKSVKTKHFGEDKLTADGSDKQFDMANNMANNMANKMEEFIVEPLFKLLQNIGGLADKLGCNAYIIGGIVRDLVIGNKNEDIDIVVEGDGILFAKHLAAEYGGTVRAHEKFGTAIWKPAISEINEILVDEDELKIDIATARREYYDFPAALPTVERSTLKEDLFRRDFTINAMAIQLNHHKFGQLIDFFHGMNDIGNKRIRVLYNLSFVEDPTRILRAVRFEQRFGFLMDDQTLGLVQYSLDKMADVSEPRIANELKTLFNEKHPVEAIKRLDVLGVWEHILAEYTVDNNVKTIINEQVIQTAENIKDYFASFASYNKAESSNLDNINCLNSSKNVGKWMCYLLAVIYQNGSNDDWYEQALKYSLNNEDVELLDHIQSLQAVFATLAGFSLGDLHRQLHTYRMEAIIFLLSTETLPTAIIEHQQQILQYLSKREQIPVFITGKDLQEMGIKPGPVYSTILFELKCAYLDGAIVEQQQAISWVQSYISTI